MKLVTPYSSKKSWIAIADDANESELVRRIRSSDIILSDLDKTDAYPGREIVLSFLTNTKNIFDRKFVHWLKTTGHLLYLEGKQAFNDVVLSFANSFIKTPHELTRIKKKYQPSYVKTTFFDGVPEFYAALPHALKIYVTRNIEEIATAYATSAGFTYSLHEQYDKKEAVDLIRKQFSERKRYLIRGDSAEDEAMAARCRELLHEEDLAKRIDDLMYINVAGSYRTMNPCADVNTSRNQTALAAWVKG